jgi:molecular chaperone IbpA
VKVAGANLENGLLSVELIREIPEEFKPRRIEVGSATTSLPAQASRPELVSRQQNQQTNAA